MKKTFQQAREIYNIMIKLVAEIASLPREEIRWKSQLKDFENWDGRSTMEAILEGESYCEGRSYGIYERVVSSRSFRKVGDLVAYLISPKRYLERERTKIKDALSRYDTIPFDQPFTVSL